MKKLLIFSLAFLCSANAFAITVTGHANATIKKSLSATEAQQMDFGIITSEASAGTVTMDTSGTRSSTLNFYGTAKTGQFTISGEPSTALTISIADGTISNGTETMTVSNFTTSSTPTSNTTDSSGNLTLNVGADLSVGANQASGLYTGTYNVTISY